MKAKIIEIVLSVTGLSYGAVMSKCRQRDLVLARSLIAFFLKRNTYYTLAEIGYIIGRRDHVTAMHSINNIELVAIKQPPYRAKTALIKGYIDEITTWLKANINKEVIFCDINTIEIKEDNVLNLWKLKYN